MSTSQINPEDHHTAIRTLQIITAAMIIGAASFLAIIVLLVPRLVPPQGPAGEAPLGLAGGFQPITLAALFMGASGLVLSYIIPTLVVDRGRKQIAREKRVTDSSARPSPIVQASDAGRLIGLYQNQIIMGSALLEGGAFFAATAYMVERHPLALGLAVILIVSLMLRMPTRDRFANWMEQQLSLIQEERQSVY